ncbi:MAG TPA: DEAD/DEAH box helicase family protein, partial [Candidatus Thermoplasmatota archaeon]|nr:DEAD/DEAH box helicase family protein [Candidatus Thermoplasmatota archaeon]
AGQASLALDEAERSVEMLQRTLADRKAAILARLQELVEEERASHVHLETGDFEAFLREPYCIVPTKPGEWTVVVPRWVDFHIGVLESSTPSYNKFRVNKFAKWLGNVPKQLEAQFPFKDPLPAVVEDGFVHVRGKRDQDAAWERYSDHLVRREGETRLRVKEGAEFRLIASMIDDGILPFAPHPVRKEHLRQKPAWAHEPNLFNQEGELVPGQSHALTLRPYQERAWAEFLAKGAVGVFWPMGAGKTVIGLQVVANLDGPVLIVVPTSTLVEQWWERVKKHIHYDQRKQVEIVTYAGLDKIRARLARDPKFRYRCIIFDECHVLPANTFSKAATIPTDYRLGLSATPYREDGRTDYIFALTGWPVGLDWQELIELGVVQVPEIHVSLSTDEPSKHAVLERLLQDKKKTLVFCDSIQKGNDLSRKLGLLFVDGGTSNRLEKIRHQIATRGAVIVSRVGDEGLSLQELERVIEVDFLYGSRRQEGQRMGRLFHATAKGEHWVLMTREEHEKYDKRLLAIREKGFRIKLHKEGTA